MSAQGGSAPQDVFEVAIADGVAHLKLNRPDKLNSMNRAFWSALPAIVRDIDDNARARAIVISSTGKHFSAGMDLEVFAENGALAAAQAGPARCQRGVPPSRAWLARHVLLPRRGAHPGDRRHPGRLHRRRRGHDLGLRHPLLHGGCVLLHPGDQPRHDGRCRHLPASVQADPGGLGAGAGLHRPPPAGGKGQGHRPRQRGLSPITRR